MSRHRQFIVPARKFHEACIPLMVRLFASLREDRLSLARKKKGKENRLAYLDHLPVILSRQYSAHSLDKAKEPLKARRQEFPSLDFQPNSEDPLQGLANLNIRHESTSSSAFSSR